MPFLPISIPGDLMKVFVYTKRRRSVRFKPDAENHIARIDVQNLEGQFAPQITALVVDESYDGCGLVFQNQKGFEIGEVCRLQVGQIGPFQAEVRWKQKLDEQLLKVGFRYLEKK